ncbi:MAG: metal ABC transporter ATP-binding protein [Dehalococcoidia bacterium]|nr:metal ABC transporter ATP-binding protein [Dehalococcoidia bacterium]
MKRPTFSAGSAPPLSAENVTVTFGNVKVLDSVTFSVGPGCLMGVVGPNGAGKSTLFNALVGLVPVDEGQVFIHGRSINDSRGIVAYVPQYEKINSRMPMKAEEVVMMGRVRRIGWFRRPGQVDREAVRGALEQVGMWDRRSYLVDELSGGQRQRVFVARALAQGADILLLDEAFSGVDIASQESLVTVLHELRDEGRTILLSSHDINHVAHCCDECLCINNHVCACGAPRDVLTAEVLEELYGPYGLAPIHGGVLDGHNR